MMAYDRSNKSNAWTELLRIEPIPGSSIGARLFVDGHELHGVTSYLVGHRAGDIPRVTVEFNARYVEIGCNACGLSESKPATGALEEALTHTQRSPAIGAVKRTAETGENLDQE